MRPDSRLRFWEGETLPLHDGINLIRGGGHFAGGAILTMLADTMMPEAYEHGGKLVGPVTTLGFGVAFAITVLD